MSYIVTYKLNREHDSFWYVESLDELPKVIAEYLVEYDEDFDSNDDYFPITGIYEISKEISIREPAKKKYELGEFTQQVKDIISKTLQERENMWNEYKREREENQKKQEEAQFERLKAKLGK